MSDRDDLLYEMRLGKIDEDTTDRLLAGRIDPDDAPPGYAEVARILQAAGSLPRSEHLSREVEHVAAAREAMSLRSPSIGGAGGSPTRRHRLLAGGLPGARQGRDLGAGERDASCQHRSRDLEHRHDDHLDRRREGSRDLDGGERREEPGRSARPRWTDRGTLPASVRRWDGHRGRGQRWQEHARDREGEREERRPEHGRFGERASRIRLAAEPFRDRFQPRRIAWRHVPWLPEPVVGPSGDQVEMEMEDVLPPGLPVRLEDRHPVRLQPLAQ